MIYQDATERNFSYFLIDSLLGLYTPRFAYSMLSCKIRTRKMLEMTCQLILTKSLEGFQLIRGLLANC